MNPATNPATIEPSDSPAATGAPCCATEPVHVAGTSPYPWPYDGRLAPARLALVVVGWDEHWRTAVAPAGTGAVAAAVANIMRLASAVDRTFTVAHPPLPSRAAVAPPTNRCRRWG